MDNQRFFLWIALAAILFMLWTKWQQEQAVTTPPVVTTPTADAPAAPTGTTIPVAPDSPPSTTKAPVIKAPALEQGRRIRVQTDLLVAEIDTLGGDLRLLGLRRYPVSLKKPDVPFALLKDSGDEVFVAQSGLIGHKREYPYHKTVFRAERDRYVLAEGQDNLDVKLRWRSPDGIDYTKIYTFRRDSYVVRVDYVVNNRSKRAWEGYLYGQFLRTQPAEEGGMMAMRTFTGGVIYTPEDRYEKIDFSDMAEEPLRRDVTGGWAAMMQHYFVGAWMPAKDQAGQLYTNSIGGDRYVVGYKHTTPAQAAPGGKTRIGIDLYAGPKEISRLKKLAEGMELTVDFGWLTVLSAPLFWLLDYIHSWLGNWGWAIIVLTIMIKAVFYPLNTTSYKSMAKMKNLAPRLKALKERYGDDKERYNKEMMALYKSEKVNPMGGCLPMVVQIPVFIALYWVLLESVEMRQAPFVLWIQDLSAPDPYFVLPILMGISMFGTTWLQPATDPLQRRIFMAMPIMFTVFFLFFPAGLVLYWLINNILQFIQQFYITRKVGIKAK